MVTGDELLYVGFNQDHGCFACGTKSGFVVYNSYPLKIKQRRVIQGLSSGCSKVEMLYRCNFLALVGRESCPQLPSTKVAVWDCETRQVAAELAFSSDVRRVRLSRDRIVVALDTMVKVFSFTRPPQQSCVFESGPNPNGLLVLSPSYQNVVIAFPSRKVGYVTLIRLIAEGANDEKEIEAHKGKLAQIAISQDGKLLATASAKGTLIRVWNTATLEKVYELRRGVSDAFTYSINFSSDCSLLCSLSSRGTCHIWKLADVQDKKSLLDGRRSVAQVQIPDFVQKSGFDPSVEPYQCAFTPDMKRLLVICDNGTYHRYRLRLAKGQEPLHEHSVNFLSQS